MGKVRMWIDHDLLEQMLDLPYGATIVDVQMLRNTFVTPIELIIEGDGLPDVIEGGTIPLVMPTYRAHTDRRGHRVSQFESWNWQT